ncbi:hypothetical protein QYE76_047598 [Lolium multiflorum]|uniref:Retrotransposon Copia-like N-terminal domain-containing protein n=1 Tax=Lolium multiflorum TaxID=4521 RepID=A0AAD8TP29_LOLMU|nr:hypothetical protein QYE76_047598 [Lolium multiflorum]
MVSNNKDKEPLKENIQDPELKKEDAREDEEVEEAPQERQQATVASIGVISSPSNIKRSARIATGGAVPREKEPEAEEWGNNSKSWDSPSDRLLNRVEHNSEMIRNLIYRIDELQELIEKLVGNSSPPSPRSNSSSTGSSAESSDRNKSSPSFVVISLMASSSAAPVLNLGHPLTDKLSRTNYHGWRAQVLPAIRGARVFGLLDGSDAAPPEMLTEKPADKDGADQTEKSVPNPAYDAKIARDQIVLGYLLQSIGPEVLPHVHRIETAAGVWQAVEEMFASHCQTKIMNLRIQLANTKKLQMSTDAFLTKMQGIVDELATAGEVITAREHVSFILAGLGGSYNSLVAALSVSSTPISLSALYAQLRAYDHRQEMLGGGSSDMDFESSANAAQRQGRGRQTNRSRGDRADYSDRRDSRRDDRRDDRPPRQGRGGGRAPSAGGRGRGRGRRRTTPWVDVTCQICDKEGHPAKDCWWRFQDEDDADDKEAHAASYGVDTNWYQDSGATHHITGELQNMTVRDKYRGNDKIRLGSLARQSAVVWPVWRVCAPCCLPACAGLLCLCAWILCAAQFCGLSCASPSYTCVPWHP